MFQLANLGQVRGIDNQQPHQRAGERGRQHQQPDHHAANNSFPRQLKARKVCEWKLHGWDLRDENSTFFGAFLPVLSPSAHPSQVPFVHVRVERLQNPYR
jgi:hypothetical protein